MGQWSIDFVPLHAGYIGWVWLGRSLQTSIRCEKSFLCQERYTIAVWISSLDITVHIHFPTEHGQPPIRLNCVLPGPCTFYMVWVEGVTGKTQQCCRSSIACSTRATLTTRSPAEGRWRNECRGKISPATAGLQATGVNSIESTLGIQVPPQRYLDPPNPPQSHLLRGHLDP